MLSKNQNPPQPNSVKAQKDPKIMLILLTIQNNSFKTSIFFLSHKAINIPKIPHRAICERVGCIAEKTFSKLYFIS